MELLESELFEVYQTVKDTGIDEISECMEMNFYFYDHNSKDGVNSKYHPTHVYVVSEYHFQTAAKHLREHLHPNPNEYQSNPNPLSVPVCTNKRIYKSKGKKFSWF